MRIVFIGTGEWGGPALQALVESGAHEVIGVVTQPDRPAGRGGKLTASPIKQLAFKLKLKVFQPEKINGRTALAQLEYLKPDAFVVAAYGQILSKKVLEIPKYGSLNLHASLLPRHRGASPLQTAIRVGDKKTGVTIMWMDAGLDTGDMLLQVPTTIRSNDTAQTVHDRLSQRAAKALLRSLELVAKGKAPRIPQEETLATYAPKLAKEDGGIDWTLSPVEIDRHIRAMTPWPSAYTWVMDGNSRRMLKVFTTIVSKRAKGKPGEVLKIDKHGVLVAAGSGGLLLREVQLEGKQRMKAEAFARGFRLAPGIILGPAGERVAK